MLLYGVLDPAHKMFTAIDVSFGALCNTTHRLSLFHVRLVFLYVLNNVGGGRLAWGVIRPNPIPPPGNPHNSRVFEGID